MDKQLDLEQQINAQNGQTQEEIKATPREAFGFLPNFKMPVDKNKQDRLLSSSISTALAIKMEFELMSYRVQDQKTFVENTYSIVDRFLSSYEANKEKSKN